MPCSTREERNACQMRWYYRNQKKQIAWVKKQKAKVRAWFRAFKATLSCPCGESDPRCLDFHHRDPKKKKRAVADMVSRGSFRQLKKEIAKCKVLCSNCHRKRTFKL